MQIKQIKSLQYLKKSLRGEAVKEFSQLECALLDILHRQRLYPDHESLSLEQDDILQKLDVLAQNNIHKNLIVLDEMTAFQPASISPAPDKLSLPTFAPAKYIDSNPSFPRSTVKLLTDYVPISYCSQQTKETYPLITLHLDNRYSSKEYVANVSVSFHEYSDPIKCQITIPAETQPAIPFLPLIRTKHMQEITEQCRVTLYIEIEYLAPFPGRDPHTQTIDFLSRNTALLWRCQENDLLVDCTPYLAAWVTPHHPTIKKLASQAAHMLSATGMQGYNVSGNREEQAQAIREQVKAIFDVLHNAGMVYVSSSEKIQASLDRVQKTQLIRLPSEVIASGGSANCIDGTVLFASLLEQVNLHPLIFLRTGHALVGWYVFKDEPIYEFLETTRIHSGDFQLALQEGQMQYQQSYKRKALGKTIINPFGYAFLIDIAECRRKHIISME